MNEVDKNHRPELWFNVPASESVDHLAFITLVCTFSGTVILVLAFLLLHSLILVVYVLVVVQWCVFMRVSHYNLRVGLWWSWYCDSTFNLWTVRVLLCSEALETSSLLAVEVSVFSWSSPCSAIMEGEFAMFLSRMKNVNVLPTYCSRAYSICDK